MEREIMNQDMNVEEMEIDLVELFYFLRKKIGWILLALLLGSGAAGAITHYWITPIYTAAAKVYMVSATSGTVLDLADFNIGSSLSQDYGELLKIRPVFNGVIEELELDYKYDDMLENVTIEPVGNTRILKITVEDKDPEIAQLIANELADAAVEYIPKLMDTSEPHIAEYAIVPEKQSSPNMVWNCLVSGAVCALVLIGIFSFSFVRDDTLKNSEDIKQSFGVIPLTVIPEGKIDTFLKDREISTIRKNDNGKEVWDLN